jgi:glycosyltransferase involved in cell wall biosynthesis
LSVILSTRNRAASLDQTLQSFAHLAPQGLTWEAIVVDNGSSDVTPQVLERWSSRLPLIALSEPTPGKNRALNRAVPVASGELLVFTDDDVLPDPNWLRELHEGARRWPDDSIFGGFVEPKFPASAPKYLTSAEFRMAGVAFARYNPEPREGPTKNYPFGPNLVFRRQVFDSRRYAEDFDIKVGERLYPHASETELLERLRVEGYRYIYLPAARVQHVIQENQLTWPWLRQRAFTYGRGDSRFDDEFHGARLFGAPRYMWRKLAESALQVPLAALRGRRAACEAKMQLYYLAGAIAQHRQRDRSRMPAATECLSPVEKPA